MRFLPKRALVHLNALYLHPEGRGLRWVLIVMSCAIEIVMCAMDLLYKSEVCCWKPNYFGSCGGYTVSFQAGKN